MLYFGLGILTTVIQVHLAMMRVDQAHWPEGLVVDDCVFSTDNYPKKLFEPYMFMARSPASRVLITEGFH